MNEIKAPTEYMPVPVDLARQIALKCRKDVVVIVSIDREFEKTHITTYGSTPQDKIDAGHYGELIDKGLGCGGPLEHFEDFRQRPAAERAAQIEQAHQTIRMMAARLSELDPRDVAFQFEGETYRPQYRASAILSQK